MTASGRLFEGSAMNWITLDAELRQKIGDLSKLVGIRDERGRVVGQFVPTPAEVYEPPLDWAELEREANETTEWYTSDEVLGMLKTLDEGK
jgi:hypothetical protein